MKKFFTVLFAIFFILFWMVITFQSCTSSTSYEPDYDEEEEFDLYDSAQALHKLKRTWLDYYSDEEYTIEYSVAAQESDSSSKARNGIEITKWEGGFDFWKQVYKKLYEQNKDRLTFVQDSLLHLRDSLQLSREDFARVVVAFVQDIPYHYIVSDSCDAKHSDFPCVPFTRYGLLSPIEFLNTLDGDCDTRTVLLFTMLRNFGYEPVIINSEQYLHSMLALDIPVTGEYLIHNGRRYAFWETTNTGWLPGMLPPDMNNTTYWKVILDL